MPTASSRSACIDPDQLCVDTFDAPRQLQSLSNLELQKKGKFGKSSPTIDRHYIPLGHSHQNPRLKMHWLAVIATSVLSTTALAAKNPVDRFQEFHTKALTQNSVKLDDGLYRRLSNTPRDYTAAVLLTAMDARYACQMCREFQPEWDLLARSWVKGDKVGAARLVYGTLDFADGKDTFMSVCGSSYSKKAWKIMSRC